MRYVASLACLYVLCADGRTRFQRVVLLEIWKAFEEKYGTTEEVIKVQGMMPITSKRRVVDKETGQTVEGTLITSAQADHVLSSVSDWDIVFADDERESNPTSFKFLQMAHAWAAKKSTGASAPSMLFTKASTSQAEEPADRNHAEDDHSDSASSHDDD